MSDEYRPSSRAVATSVSRSGRSSGSPPDRPSCSTPSAFASRKTRHHSSVVSSVLKRAPAKSSGLEQYGHCNGHRYVSSARSHSGGDRKSTRLNSSHGYISYAVFCLKKKKKKK